MADPNSVGPLDVALSDISMLRVEVTFNLPFYLCLPEDTYKVRMNDLTALMTLSRIEQKTVDERLGIAQASGVELVRDRHGLLRYSRVKVVLPGKHVVEAEIIRRVRIGEIETEDGRVKVTITPEELDQYEEPALRMTRDVVNHFISVYRYVTDEFHLRPIAFEEIYRSQINWYYDSEFLKGCAWTNFGPGISLERTGFDATTLQRLDEYLTSGIRIPTAFHLFSNAKDQLDLGDYRLAVIEARTSLEVLVDEVLLEYLKPPRHPLAEACRILGLRWRTGLTIEDAVQRAKINDKLKNGLRAALGLDLPRITPDFWVQWLEAKKLRENAAHRGSSIERDDAIKAVNSMGRIIAEILTALSKHP